MVRRWLASLKLQKQKWGVARTMFLGRMYGTRWRRKAQQWAKIKGPNKDKPTIIVTNNNFTQKKQKTCADFSKVHIGRHV